MSTIFAENFCIFTLPPPSFIIVDPGTTVLLVAPLQWLPAYLEKKPRETKLFLSSLNLNTKNTAQGAESITEGGGLLPVSLPF